MSGWHPKIRSQGLTFDTPYGPVDTIEVLRVFQGLPLGRELHTGERLALYDAILQLPEGYRTRWSGELNPYSRIAEALNMSPRLLTERVMDHKRRRTRRARANTETVPTF